MTSTKDSGKLLKILVLCEDSNKRGEISGALKSVLANDRYAIEGIAWDQLGVKGWADQAALVVVSGKIPDPDSQVLILLQFLGNGGLLFAWCCESAPFGPNSDSDSDSTATTSAEAGSQRKAILIYGSSETKPISVSSTLWGVSNEADDLPAGFQPQLETTNSDGYPRPLTASVFAKVKESNETVIIQLEGGALGGRAVLSRVNFEDNRSEGTSQTLLTFLLGKVLLIHCTGIKGLKFTDGFLLGDQERVNKFVASVPAIVKQPNLTVEIIPRGSQGPDASQEIFPVQTQEEAPPTFPFLEYTNNLETEELGRLVIYTDVITSTMNVFGRHPLQHGLVAIARQQTEGRGRGKNIWLSPVGCAMSTTQVSAEKKSQIGSRLPLVQLIGALAVVQAVPNHKEINLRVKWPNAIYLGGKTVGGVLVESIIQENVATIAVGVGVNVSNDHCLNDVLEEGSKLSCASLIAKSLSQMEVLLDLVEKGEVNQVLASYTDNWVHSQEEVVRLEVGGGEYADFQVTGVDEFGCLLVKDVNSGDVTSIRPDGNIFDIPSNVITNKQEVIVRL